MDLLDDILKRKTMFVRQLQHLLQSAFWVMRMFYFHTTKYSQNNQHTLTPENI